MQPSLLRQRTLALKPPNKDQDEHQSHTQTDHHAETPEYEAHGRDQLGFVVDITVAEIVYVLHQRVARCLCADRVGLHLAAERRKISQGLFAARHLLSRAHHLLAIGRRVAVDNILHTGHETVDVVCS